MLLWYAVDGGVPGVSEVTRNQSTAHPRLSSWIREL